MWPLPSSLLAGQLAALERQQQRILHRTTLIDYALAAERRTGTGLTLGDALAELVRDINEAARLIGTPLGAVQARRLTLAGRRQILRSDKKVAAGRAAVLCHA